VAEGLLRISQKSFSSVLAKTLNHKREMLLVAAKRAAYFAAKKRYRTGIGHSSRRKSSILPDTDEEEGRGE